MREELLKGAVVRRGEPLHLMVDGEPVLAYAGETVAAALTAVGRLTLRHTARTGEPRGVFCGIGVCFDCLVTVEGVGRVRACMTPVSAGMRVSLWEAPDGSEEADSHAD